MESVIARLVGELDADSSEVAEDAQHGLTAMGPQVLDRLIEAAPGLSSFGQLCAIEVFSALGDPRPGDALVRMLRSDNTVVRQWAAEALAELGIHRAVPDLRQAYENFRRGGEAPDHSEGVGLRRALAELDARSVVLPPAAAGLRRHVEHLDPAWPTACLAEVVDDLAAHGQAVLYFQVWQVRDGGGAFGGGGPSIDWDVDRQKPWPQIVSECRDWALLAADATDKAAHLVATICWIGAEDL
ncbi:MULTISPECIES: HEAT repeat domain-containing protein [unclassified Streptomyces]|uniref:HEAT repeat domain-containing protein n=1 Tax=unclassified Streptomyces TaxID=2593676 RepID=UPI0033AF97AA